ncbi:MAG: FxsA family protein [Glaciecola sp.]
MLPLFLLFVILPISEIMLLINVSASIGGWNTFFIVIVTAFFGAYFVRQQGFALIQQVQSKLSASQAPSNEMAEGILLLIAGVLLITPGFITDIVGFLFTLPFSREPIARFLMQRVAIKAAHQHTTFHTSGFRHNQQSGPDQGGFQDDKGDIIDGEYTDNTEGNKRDDDPKRLND